MKRILFLLMSLSLSLLLFSNGKEEIKDEKAPVGVNSAETSIDTSVKEAPELAKLVKDGKLPPLEERLPEEPFVLNAKTPGQYGGSLRGMAFGVNSEGVDIELVLLQKMMMPDRDDFSITKPNIAKSMSLSDDYKVLTIELRKGLKWSDGKLFTADDIMFYYDDVLLDKMIYPMPPAFWNIGGELVKAKKINDYKVTLEFAAPFPGVVQLFGQAYWDMPYLYPKHALKQYLPKYNPDAEKIAKEKDFLDYAAYFKSMATTSQDQSNFDVPSLRPWILAEVMVNGDKLYRRNPYYWKVDQFGRQLPYIDEVQRAYIQSKEMSDAQVINGQLDFSGIYTSFDSYQMYKDNQDKGNYDLHLMNGTTRTNYSYVFNMTHKDPVLNKIFNDIRFRRAMSMAIDRQEMSDVLYLGIAKPYPPTVNPESDLLPVDFDINDLSPYYHNYDVDAANALLDEMGLKWDNSKQYRLRPDGKTLGINLDFVEIMGLTQRVNMLIDYWGAVGLKVNAKNVETSYYRSEQTANNLDILLWSSEIYDKALQAEFGHRFEVGTGPWANNPWRQWYDSKGEMGVEPPAVVIELYQDTEKWLMTKEGTDEYLTLGRKIVQTHLDNLWGIGDLVEGPTCILLRRGLKNYPEMDKPFTWPWLHFWNVFQPDAWYYE